MAITIDVNGQTINYPEIGDTNWADEATDFAVQTASAFGKLGLDIGITVDIPGTLDVTGNATLDANLSVGGNASITGNATITGNLTANGNSNLGNASGDTIAVTGILNVDSGVLYVDPTTNKVGINDATPSVELDVNGAVAITGNETVGGTLGVTGDVAINTNKFNITATSGNTTIAGTLGVTGDVAVNTNKFNIIATSGNTTIAGTLGIANGTVSAPSLTPSGDTNTGLYSISSDVIGFSANGLRQGQFGVGYGGFTGNIIQVVSSSTSVEVANASNTTWVDSNLSCSITPRYNNSKIIILIYQGYYLISSNSGSYRLLRDSTVILTNGYYATGNNLLNSAPMIFLDTISSTNPITYKTQFKMQNAGTGTFYMNYDDANGDQESVIILAEVQQ